jgi:hypothetical protein
MIRVIAGDDSKQQVCLSRIRRELQRLEAGLMAGLILPLPQRDVPLTQGWRRFFWAPGGEGLGMT